MKKKKKIHRAWPGGGQNVCNYATICPINAIIGMEVLVQHLSMKKFVYLKKHGDHCPMKFEHILDKLN